MKINWDDYSQYMGKSKMATKPPTSNWLYLPFNPIFTAHGFPRHHSTGILKTVQKTPIPRRLRRRKPLGRSGGVSCGAATERLKLPPNHRCLGLCGKNVWKQTAENLCAHAWNAWQKHFGAHTNMCVYIYIFTYIHICTHNPR